MPLRSTSFILRITRASTNQQLQQQLQQLRLYTSKNGDLRLDRLLSNRGIGTRSTISNLIKTRRVTLPDGTILNSPKLKFLPSTTFLIDSVPSSPLPLLLKFHKPTSVLTSSAPSEKNHFSRPTLSAYPLPPQYTSKYHPCGRLDYSTSGLLLFSSSGPLTHKILSPNHHIPKKYVVKILGTIPSIPTFIDIIENVGVETTEGIHHGTVHSVEKISEYTEITMSIEEGKHRQIRRMIFNSLKDQVQDPDVKSLVRVEVGECELGDLGVGEYGELNEKEIEWVNTIFNTS
ncbi:hypothetical protein TrVE_jg11111 [Triparma verrucosa]|uniref:Pseudouridine synthase RsuA/RluA-like domain-containing protein n=1 Tax=Triparma verrucosa TaxID=1606542 RepID=A0A9W6ZBB3_9STRA|nr:hypothetical protein TrVE_jg11111 [Triparma verrucosa]